MKVYNTTSNNRPKSIYPIGNKWRVSYNVTSEVDENGTILYKYIELETNSYPVNPQDIIKEYIDSCTSTKIVNGLVYNEVPIYLSIERQHNIQSLFMAAQLGKIEYPYVFNAGDENTIVITNADDLNNFYMAVFNWVDSCLEEGRKEKDSVVI